MEVQNKITFFTKVESFFKVFDRYGTLVSLTFNNQNKFKTAFGGVLSILSFIIVASYLFYLTDDVRTFKFSINSSSIQRDIIRDSSIYNIKDYFDFALQAIYA